MAGLVGSVGEGGGLRRSNWEMRQGSDFTSTIVIVVMSDQLFFGELQKMMRGIVGTWKWKSTEEED